MHDQAGEATIPADRRQSIVSGLQAASRLIPELKQKSIVASAIDLKAKLRQQHIHFSDFEALLVSATRAPAPSEALQ